MSCVSSNYQLYFGLCIPTSGCGSRQWADDSGVCHDVSSSCDKFNPSTGDCITCISSYTLYNAKVCCQAGYYADSTGKCVAGTPSVTAHCVSYTAGMGCLECETGFSISYSVDPSGLGVCVWLKDKEWWIILVFIELINSLDMS